MSFNGSGTYVLPGPALTTGGTVSADEHNTFRNDVATALTNCVTRDGQSPATANLPMGGYKVTGLAAATGNGEAVRYEQLPNLASPGPIGGTTPSTGAFTTLTTSGNTLIGTSAQHGGASARAYVSQAADTNYWKGLIVESADTKYWVGGFGIDSTGALNISQSHNGVGGSYQPIKFNVYGANAATLDSSGLSVTGTINGLTVGKGGGSVASNLAIGNNTPLNSNTTGVNNVAVGDYAGKQATGSQGTYIGAQAGFTVTGSDNTAVGYQAINNGACSGSYNVALGSKSLFNNTTASNNTAVGYQSLYTNTTTSNNTAVGYGALYTSNAGNNTAVGCEAGRSATTGVSNTLIGASAGFGVTTGQDNTLIGYQAGAYSTSITTGGYNTIIGAYSYPSSAGGSYQIVIGRYLGGKGDNTAFIGGSSGAYNQANTSTWATTSDRRIKENITDLAPALDKILALRTVEFDYKESGKHEIGFIAQEFETVFPDQIIHHAPSEAEKEWVGDDQVKAIQQNLVPYLVKAIQELSAKNEALEARLAALEAK